MHIIYINICGSGQTERGFFYKTKNIIYLSKCAPRCDKHTAKSTGAQRYPESGVWAPEKWVWRAILMKKKNVAVLMIFFKKTCANEPRLSQSAHTLSASSIFLRCDDGAPYLVTISKQWGTWKCCPDFQSSTSFS